MTAKLGPTIAECISYAVKRALLPVGPESRNAVLLAVCPSRCAQGNLNNTVALGSCFIFKVMRAYRQSKSNVIGFTFSKLLGLLKGCILQRALHHVHRVVAAGRDGDLK